MEIILIASLSTNQKLRVCIAARAAFILLLANPCLTAT